MTVGTRTALSLSLMKSLKNQPSLAVLCAHTEINIDKDCQARGNGPIQQSQPWHMEQRKVSIPFRREISLLRTSEVVLKTVLCKEKYGPNQFKEKIQMQITLT